MKLTDNEKNLLQVQYQKKFIPLRRQFDQENERFYPNYDEGQRMFLHKKRVEEFTKEIISNQVQSFIEIFKRRKRGNQIPEDSDVVELPKEMRLFVNAQIKEFSEVHRNNIFSSIPDAIIESSIYMIKNELPSLITQALMPLWEFIQLTKISESNNNIEDEYERALKIIKNLKISLQRNPDGFENMDEPQIRNHILALLNAHYEGQALGEVFNGKGKTDILIRIKNENVLIAECKFWKGEKEFLDAINQLFDRYLLFDDSKCAILLFSRRKGFTQVCSKIPVIAQKHPYFKKNLGNFNSLSESRFLFNYHNDKERNILLTILAFEIPT